MTSNALFSVEVRLGGLTVGNIVISDRSLEIFIHNIVQALFSKNPVGSVEVTLPDGGSQNGLSIASLLNNGLDVLNEVDLSI